MVATVTGTSGDGITAAARLLHDFNVEYGEPTPPRGKNDARIVVLLDAHVAHATSLDA